MSTGDPVTLDDDGGETDGDGEAATGDRFAITAERAARADVILAEAAPHLSRSRVQALIKGGAAEHNGTVFIEPSRKVAAGDALSLVEPPPVPAEPQGEHIPLDVLFEDDDLIVLNKLLTNMIFPKILKKIFSHHQVLLVCVINHQVLEQG